MMMSAGGGGGGFQMPAFAPMAGRAGMGVMGALGTIGAGLGYMGGSMMAPLIGNVPVTRTPYGAEMNQNASAYQALMLGSGLGVGRGTMRNMNYDRAVGAGRERFGDMVGAGSLATAGGAASLGIGLMGDFIGSRMIMPALGYSGGGLAGSIGGSILGAAAPPVLLAQLALQQTMEQTAQIQKFGDQYGRNAYRMGQGRPGRADRAAFGRAGLDVAIQDMTLTADDVTEITAGMFNNDLARGVRSTSEASDRLRELSRSVKTMARTLGGSYGEMMQTAGELQSIGMNINPQTTRRAVFGASSVFGMTGKEGMAAGMALAQPFVGMGMGAQGFGMGLAAQNLANYGIQTGALSPELAAAVGGREGAGAMMQQGNLNFLRGGAGMAMLAGGLGAGGGFGMGNLQGLGMNQILGRGGRQMTQENLLRLGVAPQQLMRQATESPEALLAQQLSQTVSIAESMGIDNDMGRMAIFGQLTGKGGAELEAAWALAKKSPEAARESMKAQSRQAGAAMTSDIVEQRSIGGRIGRAVQQATQPFAGLGSDIMTRTGNQAEALASWAEKKVYGTDTIQGMGRATMSDVGDLRSELVKRGEFGSVKGVSRRQPTKESQTAVENSFVDNIAMNPQASEKLARIKQELADTSDPERKRELIDEAMSLFPEYARDAKPGSTLEARNTAIERVLSRELGDNVGAIRSGEANASSAITEEMKKRDEQDIDYIKYQVRDLGLGEDKIKKIMSSDKVKEYMSATDPKTRLEISKTLSDEEKRVIGAVSRDKDRLGRVTKKMRMESAQASLAAGGKVLSTAMGLAGIEGGETFLGGASGTLQGLSGMSLSKEEIDRLRGTGMVSEGLATSLELRTGKIDAETRKKLKSIMSPSDVLSLGDDLDQDELDRIRGGQIGVDVQGEVKMSEDQKLTQTQAQLLASTTTKYNELAQNVKELASIVERIKK
jgi:hypothetical protein